MENQKLDAEFKEEKLQFSVDLNKDGENSLEGNLFLNETIQEAIARGEPVEGARVVEFRFELTKMILVLDTDRDGQKLFELVVDLPESFQEVSQQFQGK